MSKTSSKNRYEEIITKIFFGKYKQGMKTVPFTGTDLKTAFLELGIKNPDNVPDVIYTFRFRRDFPLSILETQPKGKEWVIELNGRSKGESHYKFTLGSANRIVPNASLVTIKIPDATPEIVSENAKTDEQALLAKVRYNRLIDIFLGVTTYSLQNHLRACLINRFQSLSRPFSAKITLPHFDEPAGSPQIESRNFELEMELRQLRNIY